METKKLAIAGKVIDITKIGEKTQAQFAAQLRQNGIEVPDELLTKVYQQLHNGALFEEKWDAMTEEERAAYVAEQQSNI